MWCGPTTPQSALPSVGQGTEGWHATPRHPSTSLRSRQPFLSLTPNRLSRDAVGVVAAVVALGDREVVVEAGLAGHAAGSEMALQELGVRTVPEAEPDVTLGRPRCLEVHEGHVALAALRELEGLHLPAILQPERTGPAVVVLDAETVFGYRFAEPTKL